MQKIAKICGQYTIIIVALLLVIVFTIGNPNFLTFGNFITILRQSSIVGIVGIGIMFVMVSNGLNLAVGSMVSITTVIVAMSANNWGIPWELGMLIAIGVALITGWVTGVIIIKGRVNPMIGSLATNMAFSGIAFLLCGGVPIYSVPEESKLFGQGFVGEIPIPVIIFIVVAVVGGFILNKTYFGRRLFAIGGNEETARLSGIKTEKLHLITYTISGLLAGIAGVIMYGRVGSGQPNSGGDIGMDALIAVVLGGVSLSGGEGKVINAMMGCIIIAMLTNGLTLLTVGEYAQMVIRGMIFICAVLIESYQHRPRRAKKLKAVS